MEVRFRHLRPPTLAHKLAPGQTSSEAGQSFLEVVESVTGAQSPLEENPTSGGEQRPAQKGNRRTGTSGAAGENADSVRRTGVPEPDEEIVIEKNPKGIRIDMTA